MQKRASNKD